MLLEKEVPWTNKLGHVQVKERPNCRSFQRHSHDQMYCVPRRGSYVFSVVSFNLSLDCGSLLKLHRDVKFRKKQFNGQTESSTISLTSASIDGPSLY